ncbi:hypothetical protein L9F63_006427, partial [Diploptera punctata]
SSQILKRNIAENRHFLLFRWDYSIFRAHMPMVMAMMIMIMMIIDFRLNPYFNKGLNFTTYCFNIF